MRIVLFVLSGLLAAGCNFVRLKEGMIHRSFKQDGLKFYEVQLGPDRIGYWAGGNGPTLVMLHGFGGDGTFAWAGQAGELAKHFHVVVPDLLWFGKSFSSDTDYSLSHQARAVGALMSHLKIEHFNIMGVSYGGMVAWRVVEEMPSHVERVIMVDSPGPSYTRQDYDDMLKRFKIQSPAEVVMPNNSENLDRLLGLAYRKPPYVPFFAKGDLIKFMRDLPGGERKLLMDHATKDLEELRGDYRPFNHPVLIVWGDEDTLFPVALAHKLQKYIGKNAELKIIKGGRHAPNVEFTDEFNQAVIDFIGNT